MKSRFAAGTSLAIMAAGFAGTLFLPHSTAQLILQGGFEAGLVGGVADWFAVTALFRHPLGLPIPHTSLLLKNKSRIVRSLVSSLENELLNSASIKDKLKNWRLLHMAGRAVGKLLRKRRNRIAVLDAAESIIRELPLDKAAPYAGQALAAYARDVDLKPAAQGALKHALAARMEERALDYALAKAADWVEKPETAYRLGQLASEKLSAVNVRGFMGFAVQAVAGFMSEEKLGAILQGMLTSAISDLQRPGNEYRDMVLAEIREQLTRTVNDEGKLTRLNIMLEQAIRGEQGEKLIGSFIEKARAFLLAKLAEERERGGKAAFAAYRGVVRYAAERQETVVRWEDRLLNFTLRFVEANHYRIGGLVKENIDRMDDKALIAMLEDKIGKDLQWIRVNGALCGFAIGVVLSLFHL